jgi:hypothetical protein
MDWMVNLLLSKRVLEGLIYGLERLEYGIDYDIIWIGHLGSHLHRVQVD